MKMRLKISPLSIYLIENKKIKNNAQPMKWL